MTRKGADSNTKRISEQIDAICDQFEAEWLAGREPVLEKWLGDFDGDERSPLLRELLIAEWDLRSDSKQAVDLKQYLSRFPQEVSIVAEAHVQWQAERSHSFVDQTMEQTLAASKEQTSEVQRHAPTIPGYEVVEVLGRGGMGVVYRARDLQLKREVALKMVLSGRHAGNVERSRFVSEAKAVASLNHPNVVQVFEVDQHDQCPYMVLEYVSGGSLAAKLGDGPLPARESASLIEQAAHGVSAAHAMGFVHRDIKPANILLDKDGNPKLTDFGLVKHLEQDSGLTMTGMLMGTPSYMAPEQATGESKNVGPAADVYSLGATLYTCLTGVPPHRAKSSPETMRRVVEEEPIPPRQIFSHIPSDLETICLKAMAKEVNKRYTSCQEFSSDLRRWMDNEPIHARPVSSVERVVRLCRRNPIASVSIFAVVLVAFVAAGVVIALKRANRAAMNVVAAENARKQAESLVRATLAAPAESIPDLVRDLKKLRNQSTPLLSQIFEDETTNSLYRLHAALALAEFGRIEHQFLVDSIADAPPDECANIVSALRLAQQNTIPLLQEQNKSAETAEDWHHKARIAITALHLGEKSYSQEMCQLLPDPVRRTWFIDSLPLWHGKLSELAERINGVKDGQLRSAIALGVGGISVQELSTAEKRAWQAILQDWYQQAPDTGTHSAAGWALKQWKLAPPVIEVSNQPVDGHDWHINRVGMTMLKISKGSFSRTDDRWSDSQAIAQKVTLTRSFLLGDSEVTRAQFQRFMEDPDYPETEKPRQWTGAETRSSPTFEHPVQRVNWYDAVMFCNWLSRREGLTTAYMRTGEQEAFSPDIDAWQLDSESNGYRLPTEAEWEYACRAGATTTHFHGNDASFLDRYAVYRADGAALPASKLPNGWGLFDVHGNVFEWCHNWQGRYGRNATASDPMGPEKGDRRMLRGGAFYAGPAEDVRTAKRNSQSPDARYYSNGFRVARTYP